MKLSEHLYHYLLVLKQLDVVQAALYDVGFLTEADRRRVENFVLDEEVRIDKALRACGFSADPTTTTTAPTTPTTGLPSLDAARRVAAGNGSR